MALLTAFYLLRAEKKRKKDEAGRWGGGMMAGIWSQGEGWRRRGGEEGGGRLVVLVVRVCGGYWCNDNQSLLLHRFRGGEERRYGLFLHRWKIAPAAAVDREPGRVQLVRLEGGGRDADGSQAEGRAAAAGRAIPPYRLRGQGRYVGLVSRNFFLSLGSPRSAVLADSDCVSCCVCVDTEEVDK